MILGPRQPALRYLVPIVGTDDVEHERGVTTPQVLTAWGGISPSLRYWLMGGRVFGPPTDPAPGTL